MAKGVITEDGAAIGSGTDPDGFVTITGEGCHIAVAGNFSTASVQVQYRLNKTAYPLLDQGAQINLSQADNSPYLVKPKDVIRLFVSGGGTPSIVWSITFGNG